MVIGCEHIQWFYTSMAIILQAIQIRSDLNELLAIEHACSMRLVPFSVPLRMYTYYWCWLSQIYRSTSHLSLSSGTTNTQRKHVLLFVPFPYQALTWSNTPLFPYVLHSFPHYPSIHIDWEGLSGITTDYCMRSVDQWLHSPEVCWPVKVSHVYPSSRIYSHLIDLFISFQFIISNCSLHLTAN